MSIPTSVGGANAPEDPRCVSRGADLQIGFMGLDSLYLLIEYPHLDLYHQWASLVREASSSQLRKGVPYAGYLIRNGAHGYRLSVWQGDARLYITDRVTEMLENTAQDGQGMGALLQLGPMALRQSGEIFEDKHLRESIIGHFANFGVRYADVFPIRINRADLTCDVIGLNLADIAIDDWRHQWVGAAKPRAVYFASSNGMVEGFTVGSSSGGVMFRMYDKVFEAAQKGRLDFWRSVWGLDGEQWPPVTRFEWAVKCYESNFDNLRYLKDLTLESFLDLLNYVTLKWGRLCIPQENDTNQSRWPLAPLWAELRRLIDNWSFGYYGMVAREYEYRPDINGEYLTQCVGWIAGFMARAGVKSGLGGPLPIERVFEYIEELGRPSAEISALAGKKYEEYSRLAGDAK